MLCWKCWANLLDQTLYCCKPERLVPVKMAKPELLVPNENFSFQVHYGHSKGNHDERRAILQQFIKEIRVRKDYEISITLNASFNQVEQLKAVSTYDGAEIFEGISEKGA